MKKVLFSLITILVILLVFSGCPPMDPVEEDPVEEDPVSLIFYDKGFYSGSPSWRYLEAAPYDCNIQDLNGPYYRIAWYNFVTGHVITGATGTGIGTGLSNTEAIVLAQGISDLENPSAAVVCSELTIGDYGDWFLPSKDELDLMYLNLHLNGVGNFSGAYYWSSSESYTKIIAWELNFSGGSWLENNKSLNERVRAIRAF